MTAIKDPHLPDKGPQPTLPVARAPDALLLVTNQGGPVWPITTDEEFAQLVEIAAVFGARIEQVSSIAAPARQTHYDELVWGLGNRAFAAAKLYAHLTSRDLRLVEQGCESLAGIGFATVVVTTSDMLTYDLLERLSARAPGHPVAGIIVAATPEALRRQVLLRSAAAVLNGPLHRARIDLSPTLEPRRSSSGLVHVLGKDSSAEQVREAVSAGAGLLNLITHSDGVDACMGPTTLCPIESIPTFISRATAPTCVVRGICHRHSISLKEAVLANFLIRPKDLAARLLVFHTCKGALPADSLIAANWSLLQHLLDHARIGAIVTTWEMTLMIEMDLDRIAAPLQRGLPVGEALAHFLDMRPVRQRRLRMCLFGDPHLRLPAKARDSRFEVFARHSRRSSDDVAFLEAYLRFQRRSKLPDAPSLIRRARKAVTRHTLAGTDRGRGTSNEAGRLATRKALLDLFCYFGSTPSSDWNKFARIVRSSPSPSLCPQCGRQTDIWIMGILKTKGTRRRMINCPRCGFVADCPADYPYLELRLDGPVLRLAGPLPTRSWSARVFIDPGLSTGEFPCRRWLVWPAGADGLPARYLEIGDCVEPWPMNITLFLVEELSVVALTCRVRA